ncbi:TPA: response regulator [Photobacterium damselae]|uniref:Transcriptional regulatory protein CpxR n=4 Tax=Photobacterium damselae TaxID=38293 RepID=D0Z1F8_PHODD|nr:response regulator [Photobacterium damselae]ARR50404.1 DNA-binding response regulator [Photobacterium damselae subsp. damselae]AWK80779.1 DNA-binding response regulator [Photobacterium damselae]EEZ42339.1 transcriptional regulatory protein CpxR [Photobacterium damselae subsp. damselae CIP 102761]EHA1080937.1 response regulator [Photobacterium damselae]ELI6447565.1 response regulator [Photobacterium damselae]
MAKVLLVDDDTELTALLHDILEMEGFEVEQANNGEQGLEKINASIDLVLLDVMMPKMNGTEMLRRLREKYSTPVLMLTAKGDEIDRVLGLELGADDYLPKPFSDRELLARMRAILRRTQALDNRVTHGDTIDYQDITIYPGRQEAFCQNRALDVTGTELALLSYFIQHPGKIISKEELSLEVLGKRLAQFDRAIDMHVSNLRKKLPERLDDKPRIKTLRGKGYLLVEEG